MIYGKQRGNDLTKFSKRQIYQKWCGVISVLVKHHKLSNNANSTFRREISKALPFDETLTVFDDLEWARKVMRNGCRIAYLAEAEVIYIHEETLKPSYNRYRRETIVMRRILPQEEFTFANILRLLIAGIWQDGLAAYRLGELRHQAVTILGFRFAQVCGGL